MGVRGCGFLGQIPKNHTPTTYELSSYEIIINIHFPLRNYDGGNSGYYYAGFDI
jgi:hypothetical protein